MRLQARTSQWISRALVAALMLAATPLPTLAGDPPAPAPARPSLTVLVKQAAAVTPIAPARAQTTTGVDRSQFGSPSFFKKPVGIAVLVTLAAGVGYALYSTQHDRVTSPAKQ
ncbi:MAG: hypothetical protein ACM3H9_12320 [Rhodospirillaceae bacterium]